MSISNISHASSVGFSASLSKTQNSANVKPSDFAAFYKNASEIEQVSGVSTQATSGVARRGAAGALDVDRANNALFGNNGAHFAQLLAKAANQPVSNSQAITSSQAISSTKDVNFAQLNAASGVNAPDAYLRSDNAALSTNSAVQGSDNIAAEAAQIVGALDLAKIMQAREALKIEPYNPDAPINLADKTLDFSTMLPAGMRSFIKDLNCAENELNTFVNEMIFGTQNGPHGQNAAAYFGTSSLTGAQLSEHMNQLIDAAKINTADFAAQDFNFVLRNEHNVLGNTIAINKGADLQERAMEREVNKTFQSDMALMQVLAHTNNQSATIF